MTDRFSPPDFSLTGSPLHECDVDTIAVPIFDADDRADLPDLDAATGGEVGRALASREFKTKLYESFVTPIVAAGWRPRRLILVGGGARDAYGPEQARRVAGTAAMTARQRGGGRVGILHRGSLDVAVGVQAMTEGCALADFDTATYKTTNSETPRLRALTVVVPGAIDDAARRAYERGRLLGSCSNLARSLANEPGNALPPRVFAERAVNATAGTGLRVDVLDEHAIARLKMGLILGVARGSVEPPRLLAIRHEPIEVSGGPVLGLVGKGITFDTGGISIKPADGMDRMKDDMAGGAAVIAAMRAIALLGAPMRVIGIVPSAENMPGGRALKPGDIITGASGKTIEVNNTDAEGRLVLGDGLWYAQQLGATHLVDVATLTGACVVALGKTTTGLFGTPPAFLNLVHRAADAAGDRAWPMPVYDDYLELLKSDIADLVNSGGRAAGAITGAMFLKEFTNGKPWVHMDIAGTAWNDEAKPYQGKGPTGVGVRTLVQLAFTSGEWTY